SLKQLVANFNSGAGDRYGQAGQIRNICGTLRKAAEMMDLEAVARQVSVLENTAGLVLAGELNPNRQSGAIFNEALAGLLVLLVPYEEAAIRLFAPPGSLDGAEEAAPTE